MPRWKQSLLPAYYYGLQPLRWWRTRQAMHRGMAPIMVLIYHRVADDKANGWTTSTDAFVRGIQWLKSRYEIVSLEEAQQRIRSRSNNRPCVAITFDDGYAENGRVALPLLIRERIPFTYFVTTRNVVDGVPFEHDVVMGNHFSPNTPDEIRALAAAGVEIGGHTQTHANLGAIDDHDTLYDEIVRGGEVLQGIVQRPVRYFAFPFGQHRNLSADAFHMAYDAGYEAACSAYGGYNFPGDDAFHLQRIGADGPLMRLKVWVGYDTIKALRTRRFEYGQPQEVPLPVEASNL